MATTIQLARTIEVVRRFIRRAPLTFTGTNDPAMTMGDWVRGFVLSPPFAWRWNRATTTATCVIGTQDYQINLPDFGWIEQASISDSTTAVYQLEIALDLAEESVVNQSTKIAARLDDGNGNITFRITPPPDKAYVLNISYQKAAPTFTALNNTWAPLPDYLSYLFTNGLLAKAYEYFGDERFATTMQLFVRQLIAANGGLSDSQINIFMADQINSARTQQSELGESQMGLHGRSLS